MFCGQPTRCVCYANNFCHVMVLMYCRVYLIVVLHTETHGCSVSLIYWALLHVRVKRLVSWRTPQLA